MSKMSAAVDDNWVVTCPTCDSPDVQQNRHEYDLWTCLYCGTWFSVLDELACDDDDNDRPASWLSDE